MTTTTTQEVTKYITCPECGSAAKLYVSPSMWAGIWECENGSCGVSDTCGHQAYTSESIQIDTTSALTGEHDNLTAIINICDDCGQSFQPTNEEYGYDD